MDIKLQISSLSKQVDIINLKLDELEKPPLPRNLQQKVIQLQKINDLLKERQRISKSIQALKFIAFLKDL